MCKKNHERNLKILILSHISFFKRTKTLKMSYVNNGKLMNVSQHVDTIKNIQNALLECIDDQDNVEAYYKNLFNILEKIKNWNSSHLFVFFLIYVQTIIVIMDFLTNYTKY